jgi:hypothetical protein
MITSVKTQNLIYSNGPTQNQVLIARRTDDPKLQEEIAGGENLRVLVALASNPNLSQDVERILAETNNVRINNALLSRQE